MYQLLFVDDDLDTAKEYAELVSSFTKLRAVAHSTKEKAMEAVKNYPIAIVVLDQRMPDIKGTELYRQMLAVSPHLRAIMLSGEADKEDVGSAMDLGYKRYLHKSEFRQLPALVLREFVKYQTERIKERDFAPVYLFSYYHFLGLRGRTEFWLDSIFIEDESCVPRDGWILIEQVSCGERKKITEKFEISDELKFDSDLQAEISSNIGVAVKAAAEIHTKLGAVLKTRVTQSHIVKTARARETVREISLPEEPKNPNELYVRSRSFYWGPVYRKVQCHIVKMMLPMREEKSVIITVMQPTGKVATKQIDVLSDGTRKEVETDTLMI
jgi:CheY-like chemotaxis protein